MAIVAKHLELIEQAIKAIEERSFFTAFPEHPKAYDESLFIEGRTAYEGLEHKAFEALLPATSAEFIGEEVSPYTLEELGITYPKYEATSLVENAQLAFSSLRKLHWEERASILMNAMERIKKRFFEIGIAGLHTTGQAFVMSFQANGPHALDRALEVVAMAVKSFRAYPERIDYEKPMGRTMLRYAKTYQPVSKGVGLVVACSTFPTWNSAPGIFANLISGNSVVVKPHPKAVLPLAIFVEEIQQAFKDAGQDPLSIQLAADSSDKPITKELAENEKVKLIDYTGGSAFANYLEGLTGKTLFTEKSAINSVLVHSSKDLRESMRNLAFSASLYSGQMCTGPQNVFIPETGVYDDNELVDFETVVDLLQNEIASFAYNQKLAAGTMGTVQNQKTIDRIDALENKSYKEVLAPPKITNPEFAKARMRAIKILQVDAQDYEAYAKELFGPILIVVKTKDIQEAISLAKKIALEKGAITCSAYTTNEEVETQIIDEMNAAFTPVSVNMNGYALVNQHAAFSDFHVSGGNPSGNASFTDEQFIQRRFVWIGNRSLL